jgi:hypothetical protein
MVEEQGDEDGDEDGVSNVQFSACEMGPEYTITIGIRPSLSIGKY